MGVRLSVTLESELAEYFRQMAREEGISVDMLLARGLVTMQRFSEQRKIGRVHMGFVADATKLDAQLIFA